MLIHPAKKDNVATMEVNQVYKIEEKYLHQFRVGITKEDSVGIFWNKLLAQLS